MIISNVHVKRNLIVTPRARKAVLLYDSVVDGYAMLTPGDAETSNRKFVFLYSGVELGKKLLISRDASVVNLDAVRASVPAGTENEMAQTGAAKFENPVLIAQQNRRSGLHEEMEALLRSLYPEEPTSTMKCWTGRQNRRLRSTAICRKNKIGTRPGRMISRLNRTNRSPIRMS